MRLENDDYAYVAAQAEADGRRRGWNEALHAAREAVKALHYGGEPIDVSDWHFARGIKTALLAIDALKEKP